LNEIYQIRERAGKERKSQRPESGGEFRAVVSLTVNFRSEAKYALLSIQIDTNDITAGSC
jgi:hypothetical protein